MCNHKFMSTLNIVLDWLIFTNNERQERPASKHEKHCPWEKWHLKMLCHYFPKGLIKTSLLKNWLNAPFHDDVIKWKHFPRYWPFVRVIHRSPVNYPHKGQWRGALMFSLICVWRNGWVNNREAGDLRRYRAHYDVIVMWSSEPLRRTSTRARKWTDLLLVERSLLPQSSRILALVECEKPSELLST